MADSRTTEQAVPNHVGLIIDGNRRWARAHKLPTFEGHKRGYKNLIVRSEYLIDKGVKYVTAYVFSTENWDRSKDEVKYLMDLAYFVATNEVNRLNKKNIRLRWIGRPDRLSPKLIKAIKSAEEKTKNNTAGTLSLCMNYGGHYEISDAVKKMIDEGVKSQNVTPAKFAEYLYQPDIPDVDLLIRTSGEQRLSNFMLWRVAYSELSFISKHWPDITDDDLALAMADYGKRHRRFGK
jgi:undecaprenyl diphosphate synthase